MNANPQDKPLRICIVITTFYPFVGGGETHALLLSKAFVRMGLPVLVITRRTSHDLPCDEMLDGIHIRRVGPVKFRRWGKYLMLAPVLRELFRRRHEYDAVLVSGLRILGIAGVLAGKRLGKTVVLRAASCGELSGGYIWDTPHQTLIGRSLLKQIFKFFIAARNRLLLKADRFLAISSAIASEYRACGVPEEKIAVINNGTDTTTFRPASTAEKAALRTALGLPPGIIFCYSGKLNRGKGLEFLLRAWKQVVATKSGATLVLIGSGENQFLSCEAELRQYIRQNQLDASVVFTGYVKNVPDYLMAGDAFVFPSENESLSNAIIEACACGLPCLASRVGGIPDTIVDNFNGRLLTPGDEIVWSSAMRELMDNPSLAGQWGQQARARAVERNSIESVAIKHANLFKSVSHSS